MTDTAGLHLKANYDAPLTIEEVEALVQDRRARHQSHARISAVIYPVLTVIGTLATCCPHPAGSSFHASSTRVCSSSTAG